MADQVTISTGADVPSAPKVSVIMPAYNTAALIGETLDSVFAQTYTDFEVIVINDGSPDTEQLEKSLAPYRSRIVYIVQNNRRAAGARNTGIRHARGEFLAFLDSDDLWSPDNLATQMKMFEENPAWDLVYSDASSFADSRWRGRTHMEMCPSKGPVSFESIVTEDTVVCVSCAVARKQVFVKAGLFEESIPRCDDYDMWLRVAHVGCRIGYHNAVLAKLRVGRPDSLGASDAKMAEAAAQILTRLENTLSLSPETRGLMQRRIAFHEAVYNKLMAKEYLAKRDYDRAIMSLTKANAFLKSPKLTLTLLGLKVAPALLRAYMLKRGTS